MVKLALIKVYTSFQVVFTVSVVGNVPSSFPIILCPKYKIIYFPNYLLCEKKRFLQYFCLAKDVLPCNRIQITNLSINRLERSYLIWGGNSLRKSRINYGKLPASKGINTWASFIDTVLHSWRKTTWGLSTNNVRIFKELVFMMM